MSACWSCGSLVCDDHLRCARRFNAAKLWRLWIGAWAAIGGMHDAFEASLQGRHISWEERKLLLARTWAEMRRSA